MEALNTKQGITPPQFSIITPIFNAERYLQKCFDSVLAQTYGDFEVIAIDDGSTDASLKIARSYAEKDSRFKVFAQENIGSSETYNRCIRKSIGKYIVTLDDDDWFEPNLLELLHNALERYGPLDYISASCLFYNEQGRVICRNGTTEDILCTTRKETFDVFSRDRGIVLTHNRKAIKRNLFDGLSFVGPGRGADSLVFAAINLKSTKSLFLAPVLFHALVRRGTQSRTVITAQEYLTYAERDAEFLPLFAKLASGHQHPIFEVLGLPDDYKNALISNPHSRVVRKLGKVFWRYKDLFCGSRKTSLVLWLWFRMPGITLKLCKIFKRNSFDLIF